MSQDASTRSRLLNLSQEAAPSPVEPFGSDVTESGSFPVESYADRLMDDLFQDVERMLDSGVKLPTESAPSEPSIDTSNTPNTSVLNGLADRMFPLARHSNVESSDLEAHEYDALLAQDTERSLTLNENRAARTYDRLLLGVGCISIIVTLAAWLFSQDATHQAATVAVAPQTSTSAPTAVAPTADNQFVNYLQQALKAIDEQKASTSASPQIALNGVPNTTLPTVPIPGNPGRLTPLVPGTTPGSPTRTATGLSRLYVPVYQLPPSVSPLAKPTPVAPLSPVKSPTAVRQPIPLSVPGVAKTLVGVLELGDRSAALIEINGVAQRYRIGESIATSGWTLVEVSKDQAVIRRNGEVRSVFIGQNF